MNAPFECRLQRLIPTNAVGANTTHKKLTWTNLTRKRAAPRGRTYGTERTPSKKRYHSYVLPTPESRSHHVQLSHLALQDLELHRVPLAHETRGHCWVWFQSLSLAAGSDEQPGSLPRVPLQKCHHSLSSARKAACEMAAANKNRGLQERHIQRVCLLPPLRSGIMDR